MVWRIVLLCLLLLSGCSREADPAQARMCRLTLAALHPSGTTLTVQREYGGPSPNTIVIDYRAGQRHVRTECAFLPLKGPPRPEDLIFLATDGEPVSDIRLHLIKRWWLDAFGAAEAAVPPPPAR